MDTNDAIFSLESEAGTPPSPSPGGKARSGQVRAPASRSASPARGRGRQTPDTCGPLFTGLSPSASLQRSLASRLLAKLDTSGSPEYVLTWKEKDMPWGVPICLLRASAPRISGSAFGGWPTPLSRDGDGRGGRRMKDGKRGVSLQPAGWATPQARDHRSEAGPGHEARIANTDRGNPLSRQSATTGGRGALNPAFVRWLMGYEPTWDLTAPAKIAPSASSETRKQVEAWARRRGESAC